MAVINCPGCNQKISNKTKECIHCGVAIQELNSDKIANLNHVNRINQAQRLMTYSFVAMLLFCGNVKPETWQHNLALLTAAVGFVMYIIVRIQLLLFKRKK